ncbi:aconitase [Fomitiporia mediterranea MF3/22]|uniref:aconitase n=1 Tax=Fomitiporia mediterranea (strain MF3/22) TaxID=694068 RepID=UPI00044086FF|nr:aconitase [Fomitiporia mediterranea MF3/22]EJD01217.1 aconitase [Fomitiporia mediterranea MF3/22]
MTNLAQRPKTLYDKIWDEHLVHVREDGVAILYVDRHMIQELSSQKAFAGIRNAGRTVRRRDLTLATMDHNVPTDPRMNLLRIDEYINDPDAKAQCIEMEKNVKDFGITYFGLKDRRQGIVHIIGPEQGFTLPGVTFVCGDSHTSTHGAFGALAFGIGTTEVEHVLATQTILQRKSKNMRIIVNGSLLEGVTSKDVILHIIGVIGTAGGTGCVIEYAGSVFRGFSMEARMSVCNMSIEAGARAGMVAPDEVTFEYLKGRPFAPKGEMWDHAVEYWKTLKSAEGAVFDKEVRINAQDIVPTVTWGTSPQDVAPITGKVPDPANIEDPVRRKSVERSLQYMGLAPNTPMTEIKVDKVFIGSCTNSRIEDLRSAAKIILAAGADAKVAPHVYAMIVPGSGMIKTQAEAEGLDIIFKRAGFDWREAGCSMCIGVNPDQLGPQERCASTSNRNFEGRQGPGGRTHLLSPAMAAAAALTGYLTDVRKFLSTSSGQASTHVKETDASTFWTDQPELPEPIAEGMASQIDRTETAVISERKFTIWRGIAARLDKENVDTDVIISKQYLKISDLSVLGDALFETLRKDPVTGELTDFILNCPPFDKAKILICTGENFGCGSSRENAPWALKVFGIRCVIAPSFADIFRNNTLQNGMLAIELPKQTCVSLADDAETGAELEVDLEKNEIRRPNGQPPVTFSIDSFRRHCLLNGLDNIELTLQKEDAITDFEQRHRDLRPWLYTRGYKGGKVAIGSARTSSLEW